MAKIKDATDCVPNSNVIQVGERFMANRPTTTAMTATIIRPDFKAACWRPETSPPHGRAVRQASAVRYDELQSSPRAGATNYWNDVPTGNGRNDFRRGKQYAALTIKAMIADGCASWYLEKIIHAIVVDAVARRAKGGKHSRTLPPAVDGFIHELSGQFCARITGVAPTR